jgi:hypothetical protein
MIWCGAGVTGVVHEVGPFATTIDTADNIRTFVAFMLMKTRESVSR